MRYRKFCRYRQSYRGNFKTGDMIVDNYRMLSKVAIISPILAILSYREQPYWHTACVFSRNQKLPGSPLSGLPTTALSTQSGPRTPASHISSHTNVGNIDFRTIKRQSQYPILIQHTSHSSASILATYDVDLLSLTVRKEAFWDDNLKSGRWASTLLPNADVGAP